MKAFRAWVINSRSTEGHGLLGRYFFSHDIPPSAEGCHIALFNTRREAREAILERFKGYTSDWKPMAVKVNVTIAPTEEVI